MALLLPTTPVAGKTNTELAQMALKMTFSAHTGAKGMGLANRNVFWAGLGHRRPGGPFRPMASVALDRDAWPQFGIDFETAGMGKAQLTNRMGRDSGEIADESPALPVPEGEYLRRGAVIRTATIVHPVNQDRYTLVVVSSMSGVDREIDEALAGANADMYISLHRLRLRQQLGLD